MIWHGITGTGLDHDELAVRLWKSGYRVIVPDAPGCGASDWSPTPSTGYGLGSLSVVALRMLDGLGVVRTAWIGVSKGGGLGIKLAADCSERIRALVLCDVGPALPEVFRAGLAHRLATPPIFADMSAFRAHVVRLLSRERLELAPATIERLTISWARRLTASEVGYHYDPALSRQLIDAPEDFDLWLDWTRIACPVLILRGEASTVLSAQELAAMLARNAAARAHVMRGIGHLNFLTDLDSQDAVLTFLGEVA